MVDGNPFADIKCLQDACKIKWFEGRESGEPSRVSLLESGGDRRSVRRGWLPFTLASTRMDAAPTIG
jgi:hypothetical protein